FSIRARGIPVDGGIEFGEKALRPSGDTFTNDGLRFDCGDPVLEQPAGAPRESREPNEPGPDGWSMGRQGGSRRRPAAPASIRSYLGRRHRSRSPQSASPLQQRRTSRPDQSVPESATARRASPRSTNDSIRRPCWSPSRARQSGKSPPEKYE